MRYIWPGFYPIAGEAREEGREIDISRRAFASLRAARSKAVQSEF